MTLNIPSTCIRRRNYLLDLLLLIQNQVTVILIPHHVVKWADRDMVFFDITRDMGFTAEQIYVEKWQEMFPEDSGSLDVRGTVYAWKLAFTQHP